MVIAGYENIKVSSFASLEIKLRLKEDNSSLLIFIHIHSFDEAKFRPNAISFGHNFFLKKVKLNSFIYSKSAITKVHSTNFEACGSLLGKVCFFQSFGI